jgi:hypothetical protein
MDPMELINIHWFEILLSIASIIVGIIVAVIFYKLQKKDITSAEIERIKRAREELLDVIESSVINKQNPTNDSIENLLDAVEREHKVSLSNVLNSIILLQDVSLRLQKSRHLDVDQKKVYIEEIEGLIKSLKLEKTGHASGLLSLLKNLEESIDNNQLDLAKKNLQNLKAAFYKYQLPSTGAEKLSDELLKRISFIIGILSSMITLLFGFFKYSSESQNKFLILFMFSVIVIISVFYLIIYMKTKINKRNVEENKPAI